MEAAKNNNVQLLATLVDTNDEDESEYRFLVDGTRVQYVTVAPGILPKDDRTFVPAGVAGLPLFPPGDWNVGHVGYKNRTSREPFFLSTTKDNLPGVQTTWHATRIDHLELHTIERLRQNIHIVSHPLFDRPVVAKFTEFPWQTPRLEAETAAYQWIKRSDIGPRFLGHLTEEGRVIGFVLEYIGDVARAAGPGDLAACQSVLRKLHSLGIKHGDINKHNFLVQDDDDGGGRVVLLDFEMASKDIWRRAGVRVSAADRVTARPIFARCGSPPSCCSRAFVWMMQAHDWAWNAAGGGRTATDWYKTHIFSTCLYLPPTHITNITKKRVRKEI